MAANGVIGITAQIMESSEITGTAAKKPNDPSMSIFQRISMGLKNIKKNFKALVKNKSTGLLFLLLSSSTIARSLLGQTMKMVAFMLDILLKEALPVINWILINMSKFIQVIDNLLKNLEKWFKSIFGGIWSWVRDHAVSLWPGIAEAFGWEAESINVDTERDDLIMRIFPELTVAEVETHMTENLVEGGTIDPSYWNSDLPSSPTGSTESMGETDMAGDNIPSQVSWIYEGGPSTPRGGYLNVAIEEETTAGNIKIIDREINAEDRNEVADGWFSWVDDIVPFGWTDILEWSKEGAEDLNVTPADLFRYFFGTWESTTGEEAITKILDSTVVTEGGYKPTPGFVPQAKNPQPDIDNQLSNLGFEDSWPEV
jgi:hypothetical protein